MSLKILATTMLGMLCHASQASIVPAQPVVHSVQVVGNNLIFSGSNGVANGTYLVLTSTSAETPLENWTPVATNTFDPNGTFRITNVISPAVAQQLYLLKLQGVAGEVSGELKQ